MSKTAMTAIAFDTLKFAERAEAAGFSSQQAKGLAHELADLFDYQLPSRRDLADTEQRLDLKIDQVEQRLDLKIDQVEQKLGARIDQVEQKLGARIDKLDLKIEQVEQRLEAKIDHAMDKMTVKLGSMMVVAIAIVATLVKLL